MPDYNLTVNGQSMEVKDVPKDMPLLWVLRDVMHMTGTKYGCGVGQCGVCTVHLEGEATRSCSLPIERAANMNITTIEGLSEDGDHPVQQAWTAHNVPQCGYCQAGQIMTASSLLDNNPDPSDEEIKQAMAGNICRCGTYNRIHAAIKTAAKGGAKS